jgi:hypothetical protein
MYEPGRKMLTGGESFSKLTLAKYALASYA